MAVVKMSSKGQLVVPAEIRKKLDMKPGQKVNLTLLDGKADLYVRIYFKLTP